MVTYETLPCRACGNEFEAGTFAVLNSRITAQFCETCVAHWDAENDERQKRKPGATRAEKWEALCREAGFGRSLAFDWAKIPQPCPLGAETEIGAQGFILFGPTSRGKTFIAVELCRKAFMAGSTVRLVNMTEFGMRVGQPDSERREAELNACIAADVLMIDDLGKAALTPRVAEGLFYLIDKRESIGGRPIVITTNATKDDMAARLTNEFYEPMANRIGRMCQRVAFRSEQQATARPNPSQG